MRPESSGRAQRKKKTAHQRPQQRLRTGESKRGSKTEQDTEQDTERESTLTKVRKQKRNRQTE